MRSSVQRRGEVKGSVLTFGGDCTGSFTMPWKFNTVCDIYSVVESSHCISKNGNEHEWKLEEQVAILNAVSLFWYNKTFLSAEVSVKFFSVDQFTQSLLPVNLCQPVILYLLYCLYNGLFTEGAFIYYRPEWSGEHSRCADGHQAYQLWKHTAEPVFGHRPSSASLCFPFSKA